MSLRRTGIVALAVMGLVANIQAADGTDLPVNPNPAVEQGSEPGRAGQPDAAQEELLYQEFREWLRKPAVEQSSEPGRAGQPDAAQEELLYQEFREWLRKRQLDKSVQLERDAKMPRWSRSASKKTKPSKRRQPTSARPRERSGVSVTTGIPMFPMPPPPPLLPPPIPLMAAPLPLPPPPIPPMFPGGDRR